MGLFDIAAGSLPAPAQNFLDAKLLSPFFASSSSVGRALTIEPLGSHEHEVTGSAL